MTGLEPVVYQGTALEQVIASNSVMTSGMARPGWLSPRNAQQNPRHL
jgi:hypothetical protein